MRRGWAGLGWLREGAREGKRRGRACVAGEQGEVGPPALLSIPGIILRMLIPLPAQLTVSSSQMDVRTQGSQVTEVAGGVNGNRARGPGLSAPSAAHVVLRHGQPQGAPRWVCGRGGPGACPEAGLALQLTVVAPSPSVTALVQVSGGWDVGGRLTWC